MPNPQRRRTLREDRHQDKIRATADCAAQHEQGSVWLKSHTRRPPPRKDFKLNAVRITPATNSINSANTTKERNADYSINMSPKPVNNSRLLIDFKAVTKLTKNSVLRVSTKNLRNCPVRLHHKGRASRVASQ